MIFPEFYNFIEKWWNSRIHARINFQLRPKFSAWSKFFSAGEFFKRIEEKNSHNLIKNYYKISFVFASWEILLRTRDGLTGPNLWTTDRADGLRTQIGFDIKFWPRIQFLRTVLFCQFYRNSTILLQPKLMRFYFDPLYIEHGRLYETIQIVS